MRKCLEALEELSGEISFKGIDVIGAIKRPTHKLVRKTQSPCLEPNPFCGPTRTSIKVCKTKMVE